MGAPLACKLGGHRWETQQRQLAVDEPVRTVLVCAKCHAHTADLPTPDLSPARWLRL